MFKKIHSDNFNILVVCGDSAAADGIKDVLAEKIKGKYHFCTDLESAVADIEAEDFDWVLTEVFPEEKWNVLRLLNTLTNMPAKKDTRISLLMKPGQDYVLPSAFELGLLSFHEMPGEKEAFVESIENLLSTAKKSDDEPALVAAVYIRGILRETSQFKDWLQMEKELMGMFPTNSELLIFYAEALFLNNSKKESFNALRQLAAIDENLKDQAMSMLTNYFPEDDLDSAIAEPLDILKLKKVLVVDPDTDVIEAAEKALSTLGARQIFRAEDGESAAGILLENRDMDFIVMEWKLPILTAPALLQRIKFEMKLAPPVLIQSSLLKKEDEILVEELGVSHIIEKPFQHSIFTKTVMTSIQADRKPSKAAALENKFKNSIFRENIDEARDIASQYMTFTNVPESHKITMKAQISYSMKNYHAAKALVLDAIKRTGDTLELLNLLGKILMKIGDSSTAIRCFEKADRLAPGNIDRICAIAESYSASGEIEAAELKLDEANDIDAKSKIVIETKAKVSFDKGDTTATKKLMAEIHPMENMLAFMNNKAVALAKNERYEESIGEYKKASYSIPDERTDLKAIINYNLALAYARGGDLEESFNALNDVMQLGESKVRKKTVSLQERVKKAMDSGEDLKLLRANGKVTQAKEDLIDDLYITEKSASEIKRSELCCYMIFNNNGPRDERADKLLNSAVLEPAS